MAKKETLSINGYNIPSGKGGVAVRRACEVIVRSPGIKQTELFNEATSFSRLNQGTASWVTSPKIDGAPSPASCLWERRQVGRSYHCYPNQFTEQVGDSELFAIEELIKEAIDLTRRLGSEKRKSWIGSINPGDLVRFEPISKYIDYPPRTGIFLGWSFRGGCVLDTPSDFSGRVDTGVQLSDSIFPVILESSQRVMGFSADMRLVGP